MKIKNMKVWVFIPALILVFLLGGQVSAAKPDMGKVLDPVILQKAGPVDVIVLLKGYKAYVGKMNADAPTQMATAQAEIGSQQDAVLQRLDTSLFTLKHRFENILGFSGRVTQDELRALVSMPEVELIEEDKEAVAHLAQGIPLMNASTIRNTYDGTGVSVAIVDTGIDYTHSMLGGGGFPNAKVIGGTDLGDGDADPMDCNGHGTSVGGIVAGTLAAGPGDYIGGVAHNAKLYALKIVAGCSGSAFFSTIVAAWDWAVTHKNDDPSNPILAINTSFGGGGFASACDAIFPTLAAAANNAVANGITLFGSSGNDGFTNLISSPACVSNSISVGAVYDANLGPRFWSVCTDLTTAADQVTCYSNSANFLDILGPSNDAFTTAVGGGFTSSFGGTSAASPYSAGAGAILQHNAIDTTGSPLTPAALKTAIVNNGDPITDSKNGITKPRVSLSYLTVAQGICVSNDVFADEYEIGIGEVILTASPLIDINVRDYVFGSAHGDGSLIIRPNGHLQIEVGISHPNGLFGWFCDIDPATLTGPGNWNRLFAGTPLDIVPMTCTIFACSPPPAGADASQASGQAGYDR